MTPMLLDRIGQLTHDSDAGAAIYQLDLAIGQHSAQLASGYPIGGLRPGIGSAEYAEAVEPAIGGHGMKVKGLGSRARVWDLGALI